MSKEKDKSKEKDIRSAILKAFNSKVNDKELTIRYKQMKESYNHTVELYNSKFNEINSIITLTDHLGEILRLTVNNSTIDTDFYDSKCKKATHEFVVSKNKLVELGKDLASLEKKLDKDLKLIEKYDYMDKDRKFIWWQILVAIGEFNPDSYIEFQERYKETRF